MHYLRRSLALRKPASLAVRGALRPPVPPPRRRPADRYVGFTVPDEFFVGYGFDLDERWRNLPDLHLVRAARLA